MNEADTCAWFRRFLHYEPQLRAYLRRFLRDDDDIADVVQDSYARLLLLSDAERERIRSPRAFMFTTVHNAAVDHLRRRPVVSLDAMAELEASALLEEEVQIRSLDFEIDARQELDRLQRAIAALPKRCREVLRLRKLLGFSQKEVAAELGIAEHTVEKQLARALRLCTELLMAAVEDPKSGTYGSTPARQCGGRQDADSSD